MEEILPPQTEEGAGFELTRLRQLTVFLENRVGRLQMLMRTLEESGIAIAGICIEESADSTLVRMVCLQPDQARDVLRTASFSFGESELLAVELPKRSKHPLTKICVTLLTGEINIHYMYPLLLRPDGPALLLYVEDPTLAAQLLIKKGFTLISENDLRSLRPGPDPSGSNGN